MTGGHKARTKPISQTSLTGLPRSGGAPMPLSEGPPTLLGLVPLGGALRLTALIPANNVWRFEPSKSSVNPKFLTLANPH